jgi:integrase
LIIIGGIFRYAMDVYGLLGYNPAAGVHRQPDKPSGDIDVLTPPEVELLALHAGNARDAALYRVAAFTGLRLGELRALRWGDIDFAKRIVHVRRSYTAKALGTPKSGRVRSVPLIDQAAKALDGLSRREHWIDEDDLVFASEAGSFIDESALRRRMSTALDRPGLKPMTFHSLRHTFGTIAVQAFPLTDVQAMMGHANVQTTMVYVHYAPQDDAAAKLGRVVQATSDPLAGLPASSSPTATADPPTLSTDGP